MHRIKDEKGKMIWDLADYGILQLRCAMGMYPPRRLFAAEHLGGGPGQYGQGGWHIAAWIVDDKEDELIEFWYVAIWDACRLS